MKLTFKDKFIELLDDEDVIKKLNKVLKQKDKTDGSMSAEYQRQLNIAMQENKRLEDENISLKSQLERLETDNDRLNNKISDKERDIHNLKSYNHDILEKYNSNKKELDELKSELAETKAELKKSKNAYISLKSQFERIQTENDGLKNTISEKQRDIINLKSYNHDILEKYHSNQKELDELKSELSETKAELKKAKTVSDKLKGYFKEPFELYDRYKNLDDRIKRQISNIIGDKSIMTFISSCSQYGNLEMLWDHTKYLLLNGEDISVPRDIFGYFFELLNESAEKPLYTWNEDSISTRYDDSRHICGYGSSAQGIVREIQLRGYASANTGKIIKKSVVKAER